MAAFKNRDRGKRISWKKYHASAMRLAQEIYDFHDPEGLVFPSYTINTREDELQRLAHPNAAQEAWMAYRSYMQDMGVTDLSNALKRFQKELKTRE